MMIKKHCVLVQAHKPVLYILELASHNPNVNFYIHFDKKSNIDLSMYNCKNINLLKERVNVKWGGVSQIIATLKLFSTAIKNKENHYFHLISGECVFIKSFKEINMVDGIPQFFIDLRFSQQMRYRSRFNSIFADTKWQRSFVGKINTKLNKILDFFIQSKEEIYCYFGSQWFSTNRIGLEMLLSRLSFKDIQFFSKKLCPDEHFFQVLIKKNDLDNFIYDNHRYLCFIDGNSNPEYLSYNNLLKLKNSDFWIARKVNQDVAVKYLLEEVEDDKS